MKTSVLLLLTAVACASAPARHARACVGTPRLTVLGAEAPFPVNAHVVVTAEHRSLARLADKRPRLTTGRESVPLTVTRHHVGEAAFEQVELTPQRELRPFTKYALRFDDYEPGDGDRLGLETGPGADNVGPTWRAPPRVARLERVTGRCGTVVDAAITVEVNDDAKSLLARVEVARVGGTKRTVQVLPIERGEVVLSRDGVSPFSFQERTSYDVRIRALDLAGHEAEMPGQPLRLVGPPRPMENALVRADGRR